jgi:hypothetical protein
MTKRERVAELIADWKAKVDAFKAKGSAVTLGESLEMLQMTAVMWHALTTVIAAIEPPPEGDIVVLNWKEKN